MNLQHEAPQPLALTCPLCGGHYAHIALHTTRLETNCSQCGRLLSTTPRIPA